MLRGIKGLNRVGLVFYALRELLKGTQGGMYKIYLKGTLRYIKWRYLLIKDD